MTDPLASRENPNDVAAAIEAHQAKVERARTQGIRPSWRAVEVEPGLIVRRDGEYGPVGFTVETETERAQREEQERDRRRLQTEAAEAWAAFDRALHSDPLVQAFVHAVEATRRAGSGGPDMPRFADLISQRLYDEISGRRPRPSS